jgi:hypothetical protein
MALALAGALGLTGCFLMPQTVRMRADATQWKAGVRTVAALPSVHVYEVSAGDVREEKEAWTQQAERNVVDALGAGLRARGLQMKVLRTKGDEELEDVALVYDAVGEALWQFSYSPYASSYKKAHFDYAVGPVGRILDRAGADALLIVSGRDSSSTTARKLTSLTRSLNEFSLVTAGLIDRQGRLVWFDLWGGRTLDLRNRDDVVEIVEHLLASLPERGR